MNTENPRVKWPNNLLKYPNGRTINTNEYQLALKPNGTEFRRKFFRPIAGHPTPAPSSSLVRAHTRALNLWKSISEKKTSVDKRQRLLHMGGTVRKTAPHRLLKGEIVLSRAQRKGFTHGQILKILKRYKQ